MERLLGNHPLTGKSIFVAEGRHGKFLRMGEYNGPDSQLVSTAGYIADAIDLQLAIRLLERKHRAIDSDWRIAGRASEQPLLSDDRFAELDQAFRVEHGVQRAHFVTALINIGRRGAFDDPNRDRNALDCFRPAAPVGVKDRRWWYRIASALNQADLINLYRGFVLCEQRVPRSGGGSTTPTQHLLACIRDRVQRSELADLLDWTAVNRRSDYTPYGHRLSGHELERRAEELRQRSGQSLQRPAMHETNSQLRRRGREEFIAELETLSQDDRILRVLDQRAFPLWTLPIELFDPDAPILSTTRDRVIHALGSINGRWRMLLEGYLAQRRLHRYSEQPPVPPLAEGQLFECYDPDLAVRWPKRIVDRYRENLEQIAASIKEAIARTPSAILVKGRVSLDRQKICFWAFLHEKSGFWLVNPRILQEGIGGLMPSRPDILISGGWDIDIGEEGTHYPGIWDDDVPFQDGDEIIIPPYK